MAVLERQLSAHEHGVLSGELTYSLSVAEADEPAVRMRHSLAELAGRDHGGISDLISVQTAAIPLAALLLRAAGNIATDALASEAPERRTAALDRLLRRVAREIVDTPDARATPSTRRMTVGHHLASAMRVPAPATSPALAGDTVDLDGIREAWLHIAALEHIAVSTLDRKLPTPTYQPHYETLGETLIETSAKVLCGGRLLVRAGAFRHGQAWCAQTTALGYAREMYINGLPGASDVLERAQGILLTRLARATVAITLIDLRSQSPASNMPCEQNE